MDGGPTITILDKLLSFEVFVPLIITLGIIAGVVIKAATATITSLSRERTRREIAAYIAEGSMTPEQGERLMKAGPTHRD